MNKRILKTRKLFKRAQNDLKDLGFGSRVTEQSRLRLLNRDGSFNVARSGLSFFQSLHLYHSLLTMPWWRFNLTISLAYVLINMVFAVAYILCGVVAIEGGSSESVYGRFWEAFFFSVQTFTTVGYGHLIPKGILGNIIATADAFVGASLICAGYRTFVREIFKTHGQDFIQRKCHLCAI